MLLYIFCEIKYLFFKFIFAAHLIADAYERATKKDPQNEELLSHLFMSHVRNGDYKKQQQTAMALYKLKSKNPYYFWAIMSIVMQVYFQIIFIFQDTFFSI